MIYYIDIMYILDYMIISVLCLATNWISVVVVFQCTILSEGRTIHQGAGVASEFHLCRFSAVGFDFVAKLPKKLFEIGPLPKISPHPSKYPSKYPSRYHYPSKSIKIHQTFRQFCSCSVLSFLPASLHQPSLILRGTVHGCRLILQLLVHGSDLTTSTAELGNRL